MALQFIQIISTAMDAAIVILAVIFIYLLLEPLFKPRKIQLNYVREPREETLETIAQEKALQVALLEDENKKLLTEMKKVRKDYAKGKVSITVYRRVMSENKDKVEDNNVRIKVLLR